MSQETELSAAAAGTLLSTESQPASYQDLVDVCVGLDPASGPDAVFIGAQLQRRATAEQGAVAWMKEQRARLDAAAKEIAAMKADSDAKLASANAETARAKEAADAAAKRPGVQALAAGATVAEASAGDPVADFDAKFEANLAKCRGDRARAMSKTVRENADLHAAYLEAKSEEAKARGYGIKRRRAS